MIATSNRRRGAVLELLSGQKLSIIVHLLDSKCIKEVTVSHVEF